MSQPRPSSNPSPGGKERPFLGIHYARCGAYGRIYKNKEGNSYVGNCPRCMHPVRVRIGPVARAIVFSSAFALDCLILLTVRFHTSAKAVVTQGHGIASGKIPDSRFPKGTLAMQAFFSRIWE